ncbi:TonB-dependent hemoglobin/transferrin/lactoferrin family receptor [Brevundimonas sp. GCM10030266]|uniref:TonB-dependent hemoglobin/transferrin/lactoferrin family receptor n=1 Tax=Brevundimonas sp. GCM10030266 TaxID=3273386 RepID=UPI00361214D8
MRTLLLSAGLAALTVAAAPAAMAQQAAPQATELSPVTVLATRTETRTDEVPATVTVITDRQIEAMLATDIKDLIRFEPGVSVVTTPARFGAATGTSGRAGNEGFTIRGVGGDRVLMIVDGVRIPDSYSFGAQSVGRGDYSDLDLMKSVEILRGPASALYGSDGVAGAVSFVTRDPVDLLRDGENFGARARVGYNSADEGLTKSATIAGRSGDFSAMLSWTGRDSQETETHGNITGEELVSVTISGVSGPGYNYGLRTIANPQDIQSDAWLGKLVWDFAPGQSLRATYEHYELSADAIVLSGRATRFAATPPPVPVAATAVQNLTSADTTERERYGLDWRINDALGLDHGQVSVYQQTATTRQFTFEDRAGVDRTRDNTFDNEVFGLFASASRAFGDHNITVGGDWSETTQEGVRGGTVPTPPETFPVSAFPKTDYTLAGLFVQDQISLLDGALTITPALRWDSYKLETTADPLFPAASRADQDGDHFSPKLGVMWWSTDTFGVFANWGEGFKSPTPSQVNNYFSNVNQAYTSISNPDLEPETSRSVELGLRVRNIDLAGGRFSGQLVGFQSEYENFISRQQIGGQFGNPANPATFQFVNFSDVEIKGLEAKADLYWDNGLSARFAAAYADGDITDAGTTRPYESIDPIKVVAGLGYDDPAGRFGGQAIVTWSQAKDQGDTINLTACHSATNPLVRCYVGEDFALLDLTAYWNVNDQVTARAGVFNVFDENYSLWSDVRGISASSAIKDAYTQPGRNFGLSLALRY